MAIASVGARGQGTGFSSGTTLTQTTGATITAGNFLATLVGTRENIAVTSITDTLGNTWVRIGTFVNTGGATGERIELWIAKITTGGGSETITCNFASAVADRGMGTWEFSVASGKVLALGANLVGNEVDATNGFGSAAFSGLSSLSRLYLRVMSKNGASTTNITPSTNFTAWSQMGVRSRNNALAVMPRGEFRINTSTGETSNPTLAVSGDTAAIFAAFEEVDPVNITPTVGSLTLTGQTPTVSQAGGAVDITPTVGSVTITGNDPTLLTTTFITPTVGSVTVTGNAPTVATITLLTPTDGHQGAGGPSVLINLFKPTVGLGVVPDVGILSITGTQPVQSITITPTVGSLALTGQSLVLNFPIVPRTGVIEGVAGYLFGAPSTSDNIACGGADAVTKWTTKYTIYSRFKLTTDLGATQRNPVHYQTLDLFQVMFQLAAIAGTAPVDIGYTDTALNYPRADWSPSPALKAGVVYSIVGVVDTSLGTSSVKIYAGGDSSPKATSSNGTGNGPRVQSGQQFTIGNSGDRVTDGPMALDGTVFEVAYWADVALTGAQAAAITSGGQALGGDPTGVPLPTDYWGFDTAAVDLFGGHDGTVTGATRVARDGINLFASPSVKITGLAVLLATTLVTAIIPSAGSLTATGTVPIINLSIVPNSGSLTLTGQQPTVSTGATTTTITPDAGSLTITGDQPTLLIAAFITPNVGDLTLTGGQPTLFVSTFITPNAGSVVLDGQTPEIPVSVFITPNAGSLDLTGGSPVLLVTTLLTPNAGSLTLTGQTLILVAETRITPGAGEADLTGYAPTVQTTTGTSIAPDSGSVAATGSAPIVGISLIPDTGSVAATGSAPALLTETRITPGAGSAVLVGATPSLLEQDFITPGAGSALITGATPTVLQETRITPGAGSATLTGNAPTLLQQDFITPGAGSLALTGYAPDVEQGSPGIITPPSGHLTLTEEQPTILLSVFTSAGALALTGETPTAAQTTVITPNAGTVVATGQPAALAEQDFITPGARSVLLTGNTPTLVEQDFIAPGTGSATFTGAAPTVIQDTRITPGTGSTFLTGIAPSLLEQDFRIPGSGSATASGSAPVVEISIVPGAGASSATGNGVTLDQGIIPDTGSVGIAGNAPVLNVSGFSITPNAGSVGITGYQPGVNASGNVTLTPGTGALTLTGYPPAPQPKRVTIRADFVSRAIIKTAIVFAAIANCDFASKESLKT